MDGLLLLRIDAPLYFANVNPVKDALAKYERRAQETAAKQGQTLHFIIIDLSPVYDVDASAIHFFKVRCRVAYRQLVSLHAAGNLHEPGLPAGASLPAPKDGLPSPRLGIGGSTGCYRDALYQQRACGTRLSSCRATTA